jgi:ATP-dependent Zn protease
MQGQQQHGQPAQINAMNQQHVNQFVSGLQQASAAGLTALPSRDIPQTQSHLTQDQQMQPNYVPQEHQNTDYITEHQTNEDIIRKYNNKEQQSKSLDDFYSTIQTPVLIAILYFLFQLPIVRKNLFKFLPALFSKDGNPNLSGYIMNSAIFAALYFSFAKGIRYFSM